MKAKVPNLLLVFLFRMFRKVNILIFYCSLVVSRISTAQTPNSYDRDTAKVMQLYMKAEHYRFTNPDSSWPVATKALELARSINFRKGEGYAHLSLGEYHRVSGNFPEALEHLFAALRISREIKDNVIEGSSVTFIGITYIALEEFRTALNYLFQANEINMNHPAIGVRAFGFANTGVAYQQLGMFDSALIFMNQAWELGKSFARRELGPAVVLKEIGVTYALQHNYDSAIYYYRKSLGTTKNILNTSRVYSKMALLFDEMNNPDSVLYYGRLALAHGELSSQKLIVLEASGLLSSYFIRKHQLDSVVKYQQLNMAVKDSLFGRRQVHKLQVLAIEEQKRIHDAQQKQLQIEQEHSEYRSRVRTSILLGILAMFLLVGIILYRNNRRKQMANKLLEKQKSETEKTLKELRDTQTQLIQSEKMASLGELTAGIAHEIQNPLNFVNNFSEVNDELIKELQAEAEKGNLEDVKAIAKDIEFNSQKINHHGNRADSIVKGMLQHSRASTGQKEPTDINALADEYLRLAFHGLRAKDKSFNATMKTDFDGSIGKVSIIPQDVGRVVLNLINNAFYAVDEKRKQQGDGYEPTVSVSTKQGKDKVEVKVKDNGNGIPQKVLDKIFQPFFTTKPTGQGTGLGLSLAYDIVKAHGGELKVETKEREGSEFIIQLPLNTST